MPSPHHVDVLARARGMVHDVAVVLVAGHAVEGIVAAALLPQVGQQEVGEPVVDIGADAEDGRKALSLSAQPPSADIILPDILQGGKVNAVAVQLPFR